jgi:DNA-binding transcriptional LysR family regulator
MHHSFGFDLRALEVFVQIVDSGNMTAAAENLGMTQSSISQNLSNLEKSLNTRLLDRSVRPIAITRAGRFFYDRACQLLKDARMTSQAMQKGRFDKLRHVRIALVDSLATAVGKPLADAVKRHTEQWSMTTGLSHMHGEALLSRSVDIIISDDALMDYPELSRFRILREPFMLVLPKSFTGEVKQLEPLIRQLDFVRYPAHSLIGQRIERNLRYRRLEPPHRLIMDNSYAVSSMVAAGLGWTITTPLCLFQSGIWSSQVRCLPIPGGSFYRNLTLLTRKHELHELPQVIADDIRNILTSEYLSEVTRHLPWVSEMIEIGELSH